MTEGSKLGCQDSFTILQCFLFISNLIRSKYGTKRAALVLGWCQDGRGKFKTLTGLVKEPRDLHPERVSHSQIFLSTVDGDALYPVEEFLSRPPGEINHLAAIIPVGANTSSSNEVGMRVCQIAKVSQIILFFWYVL